MSERQTVRYSGGVGFLGLLTLIFITLKLTGFIAWPWFWVLAPTLIPFILFVIILLVAVLIGVLVFLASSAFRKRKYRIA